MENSTCKNCGRERKLFRRGYCSTCYEKLLNSGELQKINIPLTIQTLTPIQHEVMIGSMLGDGNLRLEKNNRCKNARFTINRSIKDKDYLMWEYEIFKEFCSDKAVKYKIGYYEDTPHEIISLQTRAASAFTTYYNDWYPNGKKIVPKNFQLTPLIAAVWFLDDGCSENKKYGPSYIKLSTQGFVKEDTEYLAKLLEDAVGIKTKLYASKSGYTINMHGVDAKKFVQYIDPSCPSGIIDRKLRWRQEFPKKSSAIIKEKIFEFLSTNNEFYMRDLAQAVGMIYHHNGRDGLNANLRSFYLKDFFDKGYLVNIGKDPNKYNRLKVKLTEQGIAHLKEIQTCNSHE